MGAGAEMTGLALARLTQEYSLEEAESRIESWYELGLVFYTDVQTKSTLTRRVENESHK